MFPDTKRGPLHILCLGLFLASLLNLPDFGRQDTGGYPVYGGVFRLKPFADEFRMQLDPAKSGAYIFLSEQLFDGLVEVDRNLNILPSLAEYWIISRDGTRYTFHLKRGIFFHHGKELTAEDVKFSLQRLLDPEVDSPYYQYFLDRAVGARAFRERASPGVSGFKVVDKYTLEIQWTRPFVSALYLLSMPFCKILPRDLVTRQGQGFFQKPSGTGPFRFDYWLRDTQLNIVGVRLVRFNAYFKGRPYLDAVEFCPLFTQDHFLNGEIDSIPALSEKLLKSDYRVFQDGSLQVVFLGMSCRIPPLDQPEARRALELAVDKAKIIQAVSDVRYSRQAADRYIPAKLPGFFPLAKSPLPDAEQAKKRLENLGFSEENPFPTLILFLEHPRDNFDFRLARELRKQLDPLGIRLRLQTFKSRREILKSTAPYLVLVNRLMAIPDPEDIIHPLFFSGSDFNLIGYASPEVDSLLQKAEIERSWTRRNALFQSIEKRLFEDCPAIPLYSQQQRIVMQPYVRGVKIPPMGMSYLEAEKIWLDK